MEKSVSRHPPEVEIAKAELAPATISTYWGSDANIIEYATWHGKRLKRLTHSRKEERALFLNKSRIS